MIALIAASAALAPLRTVHPFSGPMPTGVTVSKTGRIFANFPRWGDDVVNSVVEIVGGREVPYPNAAWNRPGKAIGRFICVQSVVVDPQDRLWVVDAAAPRLRDTLPGGPKLVRIDLKRNRVARVYPIPESVAKPTSYLNDVRFDLTRGKAGYAFLTDSSAKGPNAIIVVDLASGESWRRLDDHPSVKAEPGFAPVVEGSRLMMRKAFGKPTPVTVGADGIAINPRRGLLYYCPLIGRRLYSVPIAALVDRRFGEDAVAAGVRDEGPKPPSDGLLCGPDGMLYATDYPGHRVARRVGRGDWRTVIKVKPSEWPDTLSMGPGGWLYLMANGLHRQAAYQVRDKRIKPYRLVRARLALR